MTAYSHLKQQLEYFERHVQIKNQGAERIFFKLYQVFEAKKANCSSTSLIQSSWNVLC